MWTWLKCTSWLHAGLYDPGVANILPNYTDHVTEGRGKNGHTKKLYKNRSQLNIREHYFTIVDNWNNLPSTIVTASSLPSFEHGSDTKKRTQCHRHYRLDKFWGKKQELKFYFSRRVSLKLASEDLDIEAWLASSTSLCIIYHDRIGYNSVLDI